MAGYARFVFSLISVVRIIVACIVSLGVVSAGAFTAGAHAAAEENLQPRIFWCTSRVSLGSHFQHFWGEDSDSLPAARFSAVQACRRETSFYLSCRLDNCLSKLPDGSDIRWEEPSLE